MAGSPTTDPPSPGTVSVTLTTDGTTYNTTDTYTISSATGTAGSNPVTLATGTILGNSINNQFRWNGTTGIIPSDDLAFQWPTNFFNVFGDSGEDIFNQAVARTGTDSQVGFDTSVTAISLTPQPVPLESDALPIVGAAVFMAGGLWLKRRRAQSKANFDFLGVTSGK